MENADAAGDALLDAAASSAFEDHDNGLGQPARIHGGPNLFHERSGCF